MAELSTEHTVDSWSFTLKVFLFFTENIAHPLLCQLLFLSVCFQMSFDLSVEDVPDKNALEI